MLKTNNSPRRDRPRVAVVKFASCDGCQLSILNLEDDLLELGGRRRYRVLPGSF